MGMKEILEGLHRSNKVCEAFEDIPTCPKSRDLEKALSDFLSKKYESIFKPYGLDSIGAEVYTDSDEDSMVDDAIRELTVYLEFDNKKLDEKTVSNLVSKTFRNYPKFSFDKRAGQFYITVSSYVDILDLLYTIESDGCKVSRLFSVEDSSDIESKVNRQMKDWDKERKDLERYYNSTRI